jgi:5-deoxy-D-glucuronate isomerase
MLTDTLFRQPRQFGVQLLQKRGDAGSRELSTRRLRLDAGTSATFRLADEETVVVLQQGRGTFAAGGQKWPVSRSGVFTERATALYLPPGVSCARLTPYSRPLIPHLRRPRKVAPLARRRSGQRARGRGNYSREVQ